LNLNALDDDDDKDIVFPTNITEYNIELNQDITEAEVLYAVKSLKVISNEDFYICDILYVLNNNLD
jgi:hypothetical protein